MMASSNVTPLPKGRQSAVLGVQQRSATVIPFPIDKAIEPSPYMRRCMDQARLMLETGDTAIIQMTLAVFAVMSREQRARVRGRLIALKALNRSGAANALAWIEYENASRVRKQDLDRAAGLVVQKECS